MDTTNQEFQNVPEENLEKTEVVPILLNEKTEPTPDREIKTGTEQNVEDSLPHKDMITTLPSQSGIDYRAHPLFLKVSEYFGIKEKEYSLAINKIVEIVDWAAVETNSNDIRKILTKIAEVSKSLPSAGYSERRYAILYRYIKLLSDRSALEKALAPKPVDVKSLEQEREKIDEQIKAYQAA